MDPATPSMPLHVGSLPLSIARRFPFPFPRATASIAVGPLDASISIASELAGEKERVAPSPLHRSTRHRWCICMSSRPSMDDSPGNCTCRVPLPRLFRSSYIRAWMRAFPSSPFPPSANRRILCGIRSQLGCTFSNPRGSFEALLQHRSDRGSSSQERRSLPQESEPNRRWKERPCARAARARDRSKAQNGTPRRG